MSLQKQRPDPQKSLVGFKVGDVAYAVPIAHVKEIINPTPLTRLPHAPPVVAGVADHRGEVVPVIDLRRRFGVERPRDARREKWILIDVGERTVGMVVDQVTEVFGTGGAELRPPPELGEGDGERGIVGVTNHDGSLVFVLDLSSFAALVAPIDAGHLRAFSEAKP